MTFVICSLTVLDIVRYIPDGAFTALFAKRRCVWVLLKIMQVEQMLGDTL